LDNLGISYTINSKLVRGLDYYNDTCFEFISKETNSAILGGGRYDELCKIMGGPNVSGIGYVPNFYFSATILTDVASSWAAGIERLALLLPPESLPSPPLKIAVVALYKDDAESEEINNSAAKLAARLRKANVAVEDFHPNTAVKLLKQANKSDVDMCILVNREDIQQDMLRVKYLKTGKQQTLKFADFVNRFNFNATISLVALDL